MPMSYKKRQIVQIGVYLEEEQWQFVWLEPSQQVQFLSFSEHEINIEAALMARVAEDFPQIRLYPHLVGCVLPHLIWSKSLILPHTLNVQECEQQCCFVLQKELPISLEELWFDYIATPLKQGFRLTLYAIRRQVAQEVKKVGEHLSLKILDVAHYAILRAFRFLLGKEENNALYLYQDKNHCFAIMDVAVQVQYLQSTENLTALYRQFCERFDADIQHIYVYQTPDTTQARLPENWQRVETNIPFIALGNALWQRDLSPKTSAFSTALSSGNYDERH